MQIKLTFDTEDIKQFCLREAERSIKNSEKGKWTVTTNNLTYDYKVICEWIPFEELKIEEETPLIEEIELASDKTIASLKRT